MEMVWKIPQNTALSPQLQIQIIFADAEEEQNLTLLLNTFLISISLLTGHAENSAGNLSVTYFFLNL